MSAIEYLFEQWGGGGEVGEWRQQGLCGQVGGDEWFPERGGSTRHAKRICRSCVVRTECLDYAITNSEAFGVWGGLSVEEREHEATRRQHGDWVAAA